MNKQEVIRILKQLGWTSNGSGLISPNGEHSIDFDTKGVANSYGHAIHYKNFEDLLNMFTDNNGWTRIESEADLPKDDKIECHLIVNNGDMELYGGFRRYTDDTYYFFNSKGEGYLIDAITHFQPITKPLKPIY